MFKITEHIDFDSKGRAQCPCCLSLGKTGKNLALIPNTDGAYKCHRGCAPDDIRSVLGVEKTSDRQIPTAIAKPPAKPKYHTPQELKANTDRLLTQSKLAKQWLSDRGIDDKMIAQHRLGIAIKRIDGKNHPCITIPYEINTGQYLQKYFIAPWLPSDQRPQRISQDSGLAARWWFTHQGDSNVLWICEGEWDAMLLAQHPTCDIATSTTGAGNIPSDLSPLEKYAQIVIWYDLDEAGQKGAEKLAAKLGDRAKIAAVPHPDEHKSGWDISDALLAGYKLEDFLSAAEKAIAPVPTSAIKNKLSDRLISTQELLDRAPDYVEFLVHDLITANELQIIAAPPRAGKSLLALGLCHAVATGKEFMGRPTQQGPVIYVNVEDGDAKLKERIIAQQWDIAAPVHWLTEFSLSEWGDLLQLTTEIQPKLVVIDTLTSVRDDEADENSSKLANLLKPLKQAAKQNNFAVVLVHHTKKVAANSLTDFDVFDTMRGSGVIRSECRGAIVLTEINNPNTQRNEWRLIAENGSYGKQDLVVVLDASTLTWVTLSNWTPNCSESQESQALAFLDKVGAASIQQIAENTSIPTKSVYTVVTRLVQRGMLVKQGTRQNAFYVRPIQRIQQLNSLLNSPSPDVASDRGSDSTENIFFVSTDTDHQKSLLANTENNPLCESVESEAQTQPQQATQQFNNDSTSTHFVESTPLKIGDRVEILVGRFQHTKAEVISFGDDGTVEVKAKKWKVTNHYQPRYLKLVSPITSSPEVKIE